MAKKVVMPRLSLTMKEGTVGKWYKKEGERVEKGEPLVEIMSEKATYDLEAPSSGLLRKVLISEGVDAPVDSVLAFIADQDEPFSEAETQEEVQQPISSKGAGVLASPAAKRLAREHGIDLSSVKGSGPEGRISESDVARSAQNKAGVAARVKRTYPLSGFRKITAEKLAASFKTAPHSTVVMETDASSAKTLHEKSGISYTAMIVKSAAMALTEHPLINSTLDGNDIRVFEDVNIGVAIDAEKGLVVPVVYNADQKSLKEIHKAIEELTEKAQEGKLSKEELIRGTFTVTNLGMFGVDFFVPIINPPEAAILAVGRMAEKPVVKHGKVEARPIIIISLAYDHRIIDGAPAARFLSTVKDHLQQIAPFGA